MLPEEIKSHGVFDKQDEKIHQGCVSIWGFKIKWLEEIVASMNTTTHDGLIFEDFISTKTFVILWIWYDILLLVISNPRINKAQIPP